MFVCNDKDILIYTVIRDYRLEITFDQVIFSSLIER